jgi:hypothetical protein
MTDLPNDPAAPLPGVEPAEPAAATPPRRWGWKKKALLLGIIAAPFLVFGIYVFGAYNWSYASGERAGYVQKFSKKGWLCKTWEGELAMVAVPGSMPEKFLFTVRDDAVAQHVNQTLGKRVSLRYDQHKGLPTTCFGETEYFVTSVRVVPQ